jgi:hypothetical protein
VAIEQREQQVFTGQQLHEFERSRCLEVVVADLLASLRGRWGSLNVIDHFVLTQFAKVARTFSAVHLLLREALFEDALVLLRVLLENTINMRYVIRTKTVEAVRRYLDWMMVDAVRRARACNWFEGTSLYSEQRKAEFLRVEEEIRARYSPEEFESLKRGPFGLSLEQRAAAAEMTDLYNASYRVLSRNVHGLDIAVMHATRETLETDELEDFLESRLDHVFMISQRCLGTLALWVDTQFECGFEKRLQEVESM